ncbi:MAG: phosphoribosylamine--glycine ligase [Candidatus Desulforudaceae bacterium]|jgi:phosphoribosylamine--glycine ligase
MRVLVVGGGGREHALVWKLAQSPRVEKIYAAPGNAGIAQLAECVPISSGDIEGLLVFAKEQGIGLTFVGPEDALVKGIVDRFEAEGVRIFGPRAAAAQLEGSKAFAKDLMKKYEIPTGEYQTFTDYDNALAFVWELDEQCVIKADGLAAGKGVIVADTDTEAMAAVKEMMLDRAFGAAGDKIVVEERLVGQEVSVLAFTDGRTVVPLLAAQDHKQVFDGDKGPNTGGMGAYCPAPIYTFELAQTVVPKILEATVLAMESEGCPYRGILYAGLMITEKGPKVLEFNVRFGDPEAQPLLAMLDTDLVDIAEAVIDGRLSELEIRWKPGAAVCVVAAAGGYPGSYAKGEPIEGLDTAADDDADVIVFHAGTKLEGDRVVTAGGRVLGVTAVADDIPSAISKAYEAVGKISFKDMYYRTDIGQKAIGE